MNKLYNLIILFSLLITSCKNTVFDKNKVFQRIDSLNMNIYSNDGEKIYSIKSPNSSYDKKNLKFNLKKTTIHLFKDKKIYYIINSDKSTLSNNNRLLELNGNVQLQTILKDNDIIKSNKLIWNINDSKYTLIGDVQFENNSIFLSSNKAILSNDEIVEFYNPVKYIIKSGKDTKMYEIKSENAYYNINSKSVNFKSKNKQLRSIIYF